MQKDVWIGLILVGLTVQGCTTTRSIIMRHQDGRVTDCGNRFYGLSPAVASRIADQEALCVRDFKEQGFVRQP